MLQWMLYADLICTSPPQHIPRVYTTGGKDAIAFVDACLGVVP